MISVITRLFIGAQKRVFPRLADNTDNMQSQDKVRQAGSKPESTFTSQAQYRALAIGFWRIISACNERTSEHNTCYRSLFIYAPKLYECA